MASRFDIYKNHGVRTCAPHSQANELVTRQGLAMTPSDVARLTAQGMPVNTQNVSMFYDGEPNPSPYVTSERRRGVDVADLWEEHEHIVAKAKKAYVASKKSKET